MAASSAAIANLALSHLGGSSVVITTLSTDVTLEGKACYAFYDIARRETLMARAWSVAQVQAALTLIETIGTTDREWVYKYRLPEDCLTARRILLAGARTPLSGHRVPFRLMRDNTSTTWASGTTYAAGDYALSSGTWYRALRETVGDTPASSALDWVATSAWQGVPPMWLLCDVENAVLEYTKDVTETREFTPDLDNAIAARLAFYVAPKVSVKDQNLRTEMFQLWQLLMSEAGANDANHQQRDPEPMSSFEAARFTE